MRIIDIKLRRLALAEFLRTAIFTLSRLIWGTYLVLTSLYCLLTFLPYTYVALIKAPPYEWMPWFVHHQGLLYFAALACVMAGDFMSPRKWHAFAIYGALAAGGMLLLFRPFLPALRSDWSAYAWSLASLVPLTLVAVIDILRGVPDSEVTRREDCLFSYSNGIAAALFAALISAVASALHSYLDARSFIFDSRRAEILAWSLISHALVAILILSILNIIRVVSSRVSHARTLNFGLTGVLAVFTLGIVLMRFLNGALTFSGLAAYVYAFWLALSITLFAASVVIPIVCDTTLVRTNSESKLALLAVMIVVSIVAIALPPLIAGSDWNGVLQGTFTVLVWMVLATCIYRLRPVRATSSVAAILGVVLVCGFAYKSLQATEIFWAKPLGSTDDEVSIAMENYAAQDTSFQLVHHILGNARTQPCADLCRILREYTNIRDAEAKDDVNLVDALSPTKIERPNIFILVIDSLRPDYLGAYNPKVDFTPNLDSFARENLAVRNVYTQYAGTTLSEPAIWSGTLLLHAHYQQPFLKLNNLEKLANTDGYQMVVSYDTVLSQILSPSDNLIKLDTDKTLWNHFEVCSTLQQTKAVLSSRGRSDHPILFYAQPMNVHQFAHNKLPMIKDDHWRIRDGFKNRIAHEVYQVDGCLGNFFSYLKSRGWYDNSIIIITADHGDATGEFGRVSHSLSIYPEVMRVPLLIHLPPDIRRKVIYDDTHLSALTDITPSLYYLLDHRPVRTNPLFGHPLFVDSASDLVQRNELFLASDERAVYGLLTDNGRFLYTTYDSPPQSFLFDLSQDPNALHNILSAATKKQFDQQIIEHLQMVADFYGYKPGVGSLLAAAR